MNCQSLSAGILNQTDLVFLWIMHSLTSAIQHLTCHLLPGCLSFWFLELYNSGGTHACIVVGLAHRFYVTYSLTYVVVKC